ncbi:uncharacterized protein LOC112604013 [Melanaphis sacchari]|uniref:uncharacterized protein LOC112604013 n=1 Tax=Melanaphis sacchari TaxID=742174 RepID=UPI000DC146D8|nr:uncharacterized protein LOC112604013 [Melanaphis sacchari]
MSLPGPNTTIEETKSMPCIELASPILAESDHSLTSYKSFNTIHEREINKPTERRLNVKALVEKHKRFQEKLLGVKVNNLNYKMTSVTTNACENECASYNSCKNMEGDTKQADNVDNFAKNNVFEVFGAQILYNQKPLKVQKLVLQSHDIDYKTETHELDEILKTMDRDFWQNIASVVNINNIYYQCLTQIIQDTQKFKNLEDVLVHVNSVLKTVGDGSEQMGLELITSYKKCLKKFGIVFDSKLSDKLKETSLSSNDCKLNALKTELAENKKRAKIADNTIIQLRKEKRDLLNILTSYDAENIHGVSLEKRLEAEQQKNSELRELIATIFNEKNPFIILPN